MSRSGVSGRYEPTSFQLAPISFGGPDEDLSPGRHSIFQMGGRDYQEFMFSKLSKQHGTVVLHDLSMSLGFYYLAYAGGYLPQFRESVVAAEGVPVLNELDREGILHLPPTAPEVSEFFARHKLLRWIVDSSSTILVHTHELRRQLLADYPDANVEVVRMGVEDVVPRLRHTIFEIYKKNLGLPSSAFCIGCFGIVDRSKRIDVIIQAFHQLKERHPDAALLVAGRAYDVEHKAELQRLAGGRIVFLDYVDPKTLHVLMALVDVVVCLRWPSRAGLSAILLRALAAAKPVITTDLPEWRGVGEGARINIVPGDNEVSELAEHFYRLATSPEELSDRGHRARAWFLQEGTIATMAADYLRVINSGPLSDQKN